MLVLRSKGTAAKTSRLGSRGTDRDAAFEGADGGRRMKRTRLIVSSALVLGASISAFAQGAAPAPPGTSRGGGAAAPARAGRPPLFFREEWKQTPAGGEHPVTPESLANPNLELK